MNTLVKKKSLTLKAGITLASIAASVALPQLFHLIGAISGLGTSLGEAFLPMHITVLLAGFLAGPLAGLACGIISPLLSYVITGMPGVVMLPFMTAELAVYGLMSGLLAKAKAPVILKLLAAQITGRAFRAVLIITAVYAFGNTINVSLIWTSLLTGLFGIILQLVLIPLILYRLNRTQIDDKK